MTNDVLRTRASAIREAEELVRLGSLAKVPHRLFDPCWVQEHDNMSVGEIVDLAAELEAVDEAAEGK